MFHGFLPKNFREFVLRVNAAGSGFLGIISSRGAASYTDVAITAAACIRSPGMMWPIEFLPVFFSFHCCSPYFSLLFSM
jgi:hypothetical protein